jgi:hypothetical protein
MIWKSDGIQVEQVEIKHLPKSNKCEVCGRKKTGNQPCRSKVNRINNLMIKYVNREGDL